MKTIRGVPLRKPAARINWDDTCKAACVELHQHIINQPLAHWSPFELINDDNCLVSMTDASDEGVAVCLFVVPKPDASKPDDGRPEGSLHCNTGCDKLIDTVYWTRVNVAGTRMKLSSLG